MIPPTSKSYLPPDLDKSEEILVVRANPVGFFQTCVEARVPHELNQIPPSLHPAVPLLEHMRLHGVPITLERGMTIQELAIAILDGAHSSATKEKPLSEPSSPNSHKHAISPSFPYEWYATSPKSGYPPFSHTATR